jgi:hypothetical protein
MDHGHRLHDQVLGLVASSIFLSVSGEVELSLD